MSEWLNNKKVILNKVIKPCILCGYCPYGKLIEDFPLKMKRNYRSCKVFGHECPVFYHAEPFMEETKVTKKQIKQMVNEFEKKWRMNKKCK